MNSNIQFISKNSTPFSENPKSYFKSPDHQVGFVNYHGRFFLIKKFLLFENFALDMIPEVKIIDGNFTSQYLVPCRDYIIEQEKGTEYNINKCLYIVSESGEEDISFYLSKNGPLDIIMTLKLLESIVSFQYSLQKELDIGHGDLKPSNIFLKVRTDPITSETQPEFRISFFDNHNFLITNTNMLLDSLAFQAPETLAQKLSKMTFLSDTVKYNPSPEVEAILKKNPEEIKYNACKSDTFSLGLILLYAATGYRFVLHSPKNKFEIFRDGVNENAVINYLIDLVKQNFKCDAFIEILRLILTQNPFSRIDFEELAIRINKLNETNKAIPYIDLDDQNTVPMEDYEKLKESYFEIQEQLEDAQQRIKDLEIQLKAIREEKQRKMLNLTGSRQMHELSSILGNKNEISSFLSDLGKENSMIKENEEHVEDDKNVEEEIRVNHDKFFKFKETFQLFDFKDNSIIIELNMAEDSKVHLEKLKAFVLSTQLTLLEDFQIVAPVTDQGLKILGDCLKKVNTITNLIASISGQITDQGLQAFSEGLKDLVKIEYLQVDFVCKNGTISEGGLDFIFDAIGGWSDLKEIAITLKAENGEIKVSKEKCRAMEKKIFKDFQFVRKVDIEVQ